MLGLPIPQLDPFTDAAGLAGTILGEGASTPAQVQNIMIANSFDFGTKNGYGQLFPTTTGCGTSPTPPTPTPPTDSPPPPAPGDCTSYTQKSVCQENNCVWEGHPQRGSCGDGSDSPPPPSPTPGGDCSTCSGLGGGACNKCPNCSWGGGSRGCQG